MADRPYGEILDDMDHQAKQQSATVQRKTMKREMDLTPRLVICRHSADYHDAELVFDNAHYIVATGCRTRELALAAGQPHLRTLVKALRKIGLATVAPYPKAKA